MVVNPYKLDWEVHLFVQEKQALVQARGIDDPAGPKTHLGRAKVGRSLKSPLFARPATILACEGS
jgi:hypothetical protein